MPAEFAVRRAPQIFGEAGEIFPLAPVQPVPHTHRWFLGVSNLRGHLNGVVDLAAFLGVKSSEVGRDQARLVGFNQQLGINCAMLVDKLAGLRDAGAIGVKAFMCDSGIDSFPRVDEKTLREGMKRAAMIVTPPYFS